MKRGYRRKSPSKNINSFKDPRNLSKNKHVRRELTENENETPKERVAITKEVGMIRLHLLTFGYHFILLIFCFLM